MTNFLSLVCILLLAAFASLTCAQQRKEITIDQLAEGVLALNKDLRENSNRLERHELRERHLGEHLKKSIAGLDKMLKQQQNSIDILRSSVSGIITTLNQREERDRVQMQDLKTILDDVRAEIKKGGESNAPNEELRQIRERLEQLSVNEAGAGETNDLVTAAKILQEAAQKLVSGETKFEEHNTASQTLLETLKSEVDRLKDIKAKSEYEAEDETTLGIVLEAVEAAQKMITENKSNQTAGPDVSVLKDEILASNAAVAEKIVKHIDEAQKSTDRELVGVSALLSDVKNDTAKSVRSLKNLEKVAVQTADRVEESRKTIDLSGQQSLYEIRKNVKANIEYMNETIRESFEQMSALILVNQTKTVQNMSSHLEHEISQVWRQIGIMYSQLTQSVSTLDKLQNQTETYVNGSLTTMDSMSGKVGQLRGSMTEVDGNLNYLLGKIALVTNEFNMIKRELGVALAQARSDFAKLHSAAEGKQPILDPIDDNLVSKK
ncbi:kinesin-1 heavy chain [Cloeon dipterum]|uniref:kinesin-1 heavy chain n=1 Tax=Cloeon dipterum TaxID=197152 RepID=UPI003220300D